MTAKSHIIFALAIIIFAKKMEISIHLSQGIWGHVIIGSILTCLIPDIDHPKSLIGQQLKWISIPISKLFGHRGFTHSLLMVIILMMFFTFNLLSKFYIPYDIVYSMIIGYMSHIIADMLTPVGVPLLWPYRWCFRFPILNPSKNPRGEQIFCLIILIWSIVHPLERKLLIKFLSIEWIKIIYKSILHL